MVATDYPNLRVSYFKQYRDQIMTNVQIISLADNSVVDTYPLSIRYIPLTSEQDCFNEAWICAIEDGKVNPTEKGKYIFKIVD